MSISLKKIIVDLYADLICLAGKADFAKHCTNRLVILTFHRCLPEQYRREYPYPGLVITPDELSWLLAQVQPYFQIGSVSAMVSKFISNNTTFPLLALSFDDGQWDNYKYALPILSENEVQATFYIPTDNIDCQKPIWHDVVGFAYRYFDQASQAEKEQWLNALPPTARSSVCSISKLVSCLKLLSPADREALSFWVAENVPQDFWPEWARMMTWSEIKEIAQQGYEIGSHSCSHAILPQLSKSGLIHEIRHSKKRIESELGKPIHSLCYPNGDYNDECICLAGECGYANAVTTRWGHNMLQQSMLALKRMDVNPIYHRSFFNKMSLSRTKLRLTNQYPGLG